MPELPRHALLCVLAVAAGLMPGAGVCATIQHSSPFLAIYNLTDESVFNRTDTALFRILYP